jgi:hypothetical protein
MGFEEPAASQQGSETAPLFARAPQGAARPKRATRVAESIASFFRRFQRTWLYSVLVAANLLGMALLAIYPLGWRPHYQFAHWAYDLPAPIHFVVDEDEFPPPYPFLHEKPWHVHTLKPGERLDSVDAGGAPVYWLRREPFTAFDGQALGVSEELVYTEFPGAGLPWLREHLWPWLGHLRSRAVAGGYQGKRVTWISVYRVTANGGRKPAPTQPAPPPATGE